MLLLRDLIRDLDIRLVAGEAGLDRPVRWVHISELADPTPWLSGGELLLTTGMNLAEPEAQRAFVERLAAHDLAGLGLGVGFAHAEAPDALREAAAELGFPLFEVPYDVPFIAVTEKAFSHLVNEQYAVLQRALSAHERLERIVLSEQGLEGVTDALATLIGGTALVYDARGGELARSDGGVPLARRGARGDRRGAARARPRRRTPRLCAVGRAARARAGAAGRAHARARERRRAGAAGLARRGQGPRRPRRVRPARAAPGGHDRRARAAAPPRRRRHGAAAGRRRAVRDGLRRAGRLGARAAARAVRAARARRRARAEPAALDQGAGRGRADRGAARRAPGRAGRRHRPLLLRAAAARARRARRGPVRARRARARTRLAQRGRRAPGGRGPRGRGGGPAAHVPRGALRARGAGALRRGQRRRRRRSCSRRSATSAPSSSCSRSRTTTRCGCSATRSSPRSRRARAPTAAS